MGSEFDMPLWIIKSVKKKYRLMTSREMNQRFDNEIAEGKFRRDIATIADNIRETQKQTACDRVIPKCTSCFTPLRREAGPDIVWVYQCNCWDYPHRHGFILNENNCWIPPR